jgi:hypothetical protein
MDHVEGRLGQRVGAGVVTSQLGVGRQRSRDPVRVDVGRQHVPPRADPHAHEPRNRPAARTDFETVPTGVDPEPVQMATGHLVVESGEVRKAVAGLRRSVVEGIVRRRRGGIHDRFTTEVLSCKRWSNERGGRDRVDARRVGRSLFFRRTATAVRSCGRPQRARRCADRSHRRRRRGAADRGSCRHRENGAAGGAASTRSRGKNDRTDRARRRAGARIRLRDRSPVAGRRGDRC